MPHGSTFRLHGTALGMASNVDYGIADLMNKGYAFGFLLVLLVFALGMYVAYTGFTSSRAAVRAQPTLPPKTKVAQIAPTSVNAPPTAV